MIKLALIGLGNMGSLHLKNIRHLEQNNKCILSCVCDIDKEKVDKCIENSLTKGFYNINDLIEEGDFDAAIIATTSNTHCDIALSLLKVDKSILIEKPVTVSIEEAVLLKEAELNSKGIISPGFTEVYNSVISGLDKIIKDDDGFSYMDFYRIGLRSPRNEIKDIDAIQDLLTHDLAVLAQVCDLSQVKSISGNVFNYNKMSRQYDAANVSLMLKNGMVRFLVDRDSTIKKREFSVSKNELFGSFDYMDQTAILKENGSIEAFGNNIWYSQKYNTGEVRYANNPLLDEIADFTEAVEKGTHTKVSKSWFEVTELIEKIRCVMY